MLFCALAAVVCKTRMKAEDVGESVLPPMEKMMLVSPKVTLLLSEGAVQRPTVSQVKEPVEPPVA